MRAILFPTDFSDTATNAFLYAIHIAKAIKAKVFIVYSYLDPVLSASPGGQPEILGNVLPTIAKNQQELFDKKTNLLREIITKNNLTQVEFEFLFQEGPVAQVVKKLVDQQKIRLVVMGTHGESGFLTKVIGTNTVNVIRALQIPVLAVPPHAIYKPIKHVVFTTLFREKDKSALKEMLIMSKAVQAKIDCVHVMQKDRIPDVLQQSETWQREFPDHINYILLDEVESVENTIINYLLENNVDIFAVVKRNRNFFDRLFNSSTSNNLTFHSKVPILVFHEEK
ncbi:MAG: universal stress protein [Sphingobacterium sp.]